MKIVFEYLAASRYLPTVHCLNYESVEAFLRDFGTLIRNKKARYDSENENYDHRWFDFCKMRFSTLDFIDDDGSIDLPKTYTLEEWFNKTSFNGPGPQQKMFCVTIANTGHDLVLRFVVLAPDEDEAGVQAIQLSRKHFNEMCPNGGFYVHNSYECINNFCSEVVHE